MSSSAGLSAAKRRRASASIVKPKNTTMASQASTPVKKQPLSGAPPIAKLLYNHKEKLDFLYLTITEISEALHYMQEQNKELDSCVKNLKNEISDLKKNKVNVDLVTNTQAINDKNTCLENEENNSKKTTSDEKDNTSDKEQISSTSGKNKHEQPKKNGRNKKNKVTLDVTE